MITMTNVCFAEIIKLGHGNRDRLGYHYGHAPTMEIVSVSKDERQGKGWTSSKCRLEWKRHLE